MQLKIVSWLRAWTILVLIILGYLHFKSLFLNAAALDLTKLSATQVISFEWLVPLISLLVIVCQRAAISRAATLPSWIGLGLTCLFLTTLAASAHSNKPPLQLLSTAGLVYSVSYALWGREAARLLWFPMIFFIFAVPVTFYLDGLRLLSETLPEMFVRLGTHVEQSGFTFFRDHLELKGFSLKPASPSSGIRSLFAMVAITAAFAHFTVKQRLQRLALFCCAIPIAIIANLFCSFLICLIALNLDRQQATLFYANYSHPVTFALGLFLIFTVANMIVRFSEKFKRPTAAEWLNSIEEQKTQIHLPKQGIVKSVAIICLVLIASMSAFIFIKAHVPSEKEGKAASAPSDSK